MPNCRKCGSYFPLKQVVDGKPRVFTSRKFCLKCSPFGQHNTRQLDVTRPELIRTCKVCGKPYTAGNGSYADTCRSCRGVYQRQQLKRKAVAYLGGCCQLCGYKCCLAALHFHHRDPSEKEFTLADYSRGWERLRSEVDKCVLLCALCHGEVHAGIWDLDKPPAKAEVWALRLEIPPSDIAASS